MTEIQRALATNVRLLRKRHDWSQAELAERAGISVSYAGEIEGGVKWPAADVIDGLAKALGVGGYQLFLNPEDTKDYCDWLERRDHFVEMGEKLLDYFEKRRP